MDAVVLSGGGAYGAYELGVLKALFEKGTLDYAEIVAGTSVGAFNAAVLCMHGGGAEAVRRLEAIWLDRIAQTRPRTGNGVLRIRGNPLSNTAADLARDSAFLARAALRRTAAFLGSSAGFAARTLEFVDLSAFVCVEPLRRTIEQEISCEKIRNSPVQIRVITTDWERGVYRVFANGDLCPDAILASTAIPSIFPPVRFENSTWVDGGVTMNTPLNPAVQAGADTIHVVSLDASLHSIAAAELDNSIEAMMRTLSIAVATAIREDMATADWINRGLAALARAQAGVHLSRDEVKDFTRVAAQLEERARGELGLKPLTIHHYHPSESLGGPLGLLDLSLGALEQLIARGRRDTLAHDCEEYECVIPE